MRKKVSCAYKYCLCHGKKLYSANAVVINNKYYHYECARLYQRINDCADLYLSRTKNKIPSQTVERVMNSLVFSSSIPVDYLYNHLMASGSSYKDKPIQELYKIRSLYWGKDIKTGGIVNDGH